MHAFCQGVTLLSRDNDTSHLFWGILSKVDLYLEFYQFHMDEWYLLGMYHVRRKILFGAILV